MKKAFLSLLLAIVVSVPYVFAGLGSPSHMPSSIYDIEVTLINIDPDPAEAGKNVDVRFKFDNNGTGIAENTEVKILPEYPFSLLPGEEAVRNIGTLGSRQRGEVGVIVRYRLKVDEDAAEDDYELRVRYRVNDQVWIEPEEFTVEVKKEEVNFQIGSLETEPTRLVADTEDAKLSVELQNIGDEKAKNVIATLVLPEGFKETYSYSAVENLGTISGESSKTANFYVDIDEDVKEGEYDAKLMLKYKEEDDEENEYKRETLEFKLPVKATPLFEITEAKTTPEKIKAGSKVELRLKIINTGTKDAESVSIKAFKEASQPFEFDEKSDFVGKLKPGQEGEAVLKFEVEKDATPKTYLLDIEIRTTNEKDVLVFEKTVPITVSSGKGFIGSSRGIGVTIIVVIVAVGLAFYYKFWNKKGKNR